MCLLAAAALRTPGTQLSCSAFVIVLCARRAQANARNNSSGHTTVNNVEWPPWSRVVQMGKRGGFFSGRPIKDRTFTLLIFVDDHIVIDQLDTTAQLLRKG